MDNTKRVNVITSNTIKGTSVPVISTTMNVILTYSDIKLCIMQFADVYEIIGKNKTIKLDLINYNQDNSNGDTSTPDKNVSYNIGVIKVVDDLPDAAYDGILYIQRSSLIGYVWDAVNSKWQVLIPHVSQEIVDGIVDNNPVTGESVKNYLTKKLNEMSSINVLGKADKIAEGKENEILSATNDGNIQSTGYKVSSDDLSDPDTSNNLVTEKAIKTALTWKIIN